MFALDSTVLLFIILGTIYNIHTRIYNTIRGNFNA